MKNLPKDTKVAVYMRVGREEQLSPTDKLINAVSEAIETENKKCKMTFKFTEREVQILRDLLLHHPDGADLYERLSNRLRQRKGAKQC